MNKIFIIFFLLLTACNKSTPVYDKISKDAVILAFGDSITYGTGSSESDNYPNILSFLSKHKVINLGVPGEISRDGLNRLPSALDQYDPEIMILIHGGNDILRKIPEQKTAQHLKQMIKEARLRDIKVVMLAVPKPSLFLLENAEFYQKVAEQQKVPIDLETLPQILSTKELKSDTIHPNSMGYRIMAKNIYNLLVETGAL